MSIFSFFKKKRKIKTEEKIEPEKPDSGCNENAGLVKAEEVVHIENGDSEHTETDNTARTETDEAAYIELREMIAHKAQSDDGRIYKVWVNVNNNIVTMEAYGDYTSDDVLKWLEEQRYISSAKYHKFTDWPTSDGKNVGDKFGHGRAMLVRELPCRIYHIKYEKSYSLRNHTRVPLYGPPSFLDSEDKKPEITIESANNDERK